MMVSDEENEAGGCGKDKGIFIKKGQFGYFNFNRNSFVGDCMAGGGNGF